MLNELDKGEYMTNEQVAWCSLHDWFIDSQYNTVNKAYVVIVKDDMKAGGVLEFNDFNTLKDWAGY